MTEVDATPRDDSEGSRPDVHIPPDLLPALLFGAADLLEREHDPEVDLGPHRDLVAALLPPVTSDVLMW